MIPVGLIDPDPRNVREDLGDLTDMMASIERVGLLQSVRVYPTGDRYTVQAGHRRFAALQRLDWTLIPCEVADPPADNLARLDAMLHENGQRKPLNPMEEARAYQEYVDAGLNQQEIEARVGRPQSHISTALMFLTELTPQEQADLESGRIKRAHAVKLMKARRASEGRARSDLGGTHRYGYAVPYFNGNHRLAHVAQSACRAAGHSPAIRIGPACGGCWESAITTYGGFSAMGGGRDLPDRAAALDELHAIAGGVRETVMTATPERVRRLLDVAFSGLVESVARAAAEDARERRTLSEAIGDLAGELEDTG